MLQFDCKCGLVIDSDKEGLKEDGLWLQLGERLKKKKKKKKNKNKKKKKNKKKDMGKLVSF